MEQLRGPSSASTRRTGPDRREGAAAGSGWSTTGGNAAADCRAHIRTNSGRRPACWARPLSRQGGARAVPAATRGPDGETRQQFLQGLATWATVGEAGARWAAVGTQSKAAERERQAHRDQAAAAARREADRPAAKVRADRERMAGSLGGGWLVNKASFPEPAWRTAMIHANSIPVVAALAEQRLRQFRPDPIAP